MNELKMGRAARRVAAPVADSEIGKAVMETANNNLSLEDEIVKETKEFIFNMDIKDLSELGLTPEQWEIILSPEKLESTIREIVRKAIQERGA